jgi:hypothetical protein
LAARNGDEVLAPSRQVAMAAIDEQSTLGGYNVAIAQALVIEQTFGRDNGWVLRNGGIELRMLPSVSRHLL